MRHDLYIHFSAGAPDSAGVATILAALEGLKTQMTDSYDNLDAAEAGLETAVSGNTAEIKNLVAELAAANSSGNSARVDAIVVKLQAATAQISADDASGGTPPTNTAAATGGATHLGADGQPV